MVFEYRTGVGRGHQWNLVYRSSILHYLFPPWIQAPAKYSTISPSCSENMQLVPFTDSEASAYHSPKSNVQSHHDVDISKETTISGVVEVMEAKDEDHVFHLRNPTYSNNAVAMLKAVVFLHQTELRISIMQFPRLIILLSLPRFIHICFLPHVLVMQILKNLL